MSSSNKPGGLREQLRPVISGSRGSCGHPVRHPSPGAGRKFFRGWIRRVEYNGLMAKTRISLKQRKFLNAYFAEAEGNASEAARIAGYTHPGVNGSRLKAKLAQEITAKEVELDNAGIMSAKDVIKRLANEAESAELPRDRIRALEILAKTNGLEKVDIHIDRSELVKAVRENLAAVATQAAENPAKLLTAH